ncbi:MAG: GGDEF domain-containing protein [Candidatus Pacebacteria bacterium]|nr:GGDEF domain-containing protein [Candidatus Paceibacterota bacterium]
MDDLLLVIVLLSVICVFLVIVVYVQRKHIRELQGQVATDPLTGLLNRRAFERALGGLIKLLPVGDDNRHGSLDSLAVFFIDLDHFKRINDTFGHDVGDEVLKRVSTCIQVALRDSDLVCRWGGEEIVVALPSLPSEKAVKVAEKVRQAIAKLSFSPTDLRVTTSVGVATTKWRIPQGDLITQADRAVYEAKTNGRNRVVMY